MADPNKPSEREPNTPDDASRRAAGEPKPAENEPKRHYETEHPTRASGDQTGEHPHPPGGGDQREGVQHSPSEAMDQTGRMESAREARASAMPGQVAPAPTGVKLSGLAVTSVIFGIVVVLPISAWVSLIGGIIAILLGAIAIWQIGQSHGTLRGTGVAAVGILLGVIAIVIGLVGMFAADAPTVAA